MKRKMLFKTMVTLIFIGVVINTKAAPVGLQDNFFLNYEYSGAGLLKKEWRGKISVDIAKDILDAFVQFNDEDKVFLRKYVREDVPGFSLEKIKVVVMEKIAQLDGRDTVSDERAYELIEGLQPKKVTYADWEASGLRSVFLLIDGTGDLGGWIPDRGTGTVLYYGDNAGFDLFCMNPVIVTDNSTKQVIPGKKLIDLKSTTSAAGPQTSGAVTVNVTVSGNNNNTVGTGAGGGTTEEEIIRAPRRRTREIVDDGYRYQQRPRIRISGRINIGTRPVYRSQRAPVYQQRPVISRRVKQKPPRTSSPAPRRYNNSRPGRHQ